MFLLFPSTDLSTFLGRFSRNFATRRDVLKLIMSYMGVLYEFRWNADSADIMQLRMTLPWQPNLGLH